MSIIGGIIWFALGFIAGVIYITRELRRRRITRELRRRRITKRYYEHV